MENLFLFLFRTPLLQLLIEMPRAIQTFFPCAQTNIVKFESCALIVKQTNN